MIRIRIHMHHLRKLMVGKLIYLFLIKEIKVPLDFVETSFKINDLTIDGYKYKYDNNDNYYLVYAKNLETGDEGFYLYDKKIIHFQDIIRSYQT